jgi:hypothetical protein
LRGVLPLVTLPAHVVELVAQKLVDLLETGDFGFQRSG